MIKYLKICSIGMMVLGILLCCGGAWIIQDDVSSRQHLRKAIYVLFSISTLKDSIICEGKSNITTLNCLMETLLQRWNT